MVEPERDEAPTTPPPAQRPLVVEPPVSGTRTEGEEARDTALSITKPSGRDPDTLMSLPRPTPHQDLPFETRLVELEDRLAAYETRLSVLERGPSALATGRATPWWFWLLFLAGLAVTWRLLEMLR